MKIYTRTGDKGTSGLYGGDRVSKDDARLHAYGTLDELNAVIGLVLADEDFLHIAREHLNRIQQLLFEMGADLATPMTSQAKIKRLSADIAITIEEWIDTLESDLPALTSFIIPGGSKCGALLHHARTICRRAERWMVTLMHTEPINKNLIQVINRLGDYLFVAARAVNHTLHIPESIVEISKEATQEKRQSENRS
jgi:cob(I)alamin adenosyltransferase